MFVNFKRSLIKRVRWTKHRKTEEYRLSIQSNSLYSVGSAGLCHPGKENSVRTECLSMQTKCFFCGNKRHPRFNCPARDRVCYKCKKKGHISSDCLSKSKNPTPTATLTSQQQSLSPASPVNSDDDKVNVFALVNGVLANCLIDTGAKRSHIDKAFINRTNLPVDDSTKEEIGLAIKGSTVRTRGSCNVQIDLLDRSYDKVNMLVMDNLMLDVILDRCLKEHQSVSFEFGGPKCPLNLNSLDVLKGVTPVRLFEYLSPDCRPVASKSRKYSSSDREFIATQTAQMLRDGIIEPSTSPWRAQVVVVNNSNHTKCLCIDIAKLYTNSLWLMLTRCHVCKPLQIA